MRKKHDKNYIKFAKNKICDVLNDNREYSDWTQISLSAKDAVKALADVIGISDEESICTINAFLTELAYKIIENAKEHQKSSLFTWRKATTKEIVKPFKE